MKKYLAELVGTFALTFLGCAAAVSLNCGSDTASVVGTAFAFGLSVVAMAYTIGGISGCHINPAITLGVFLSGKRLCCGIGAYLFVCARSARRNIKDQWRDKQLCRTRNWSLSNPNPPCRNSLHRHFGKSCTQHWPGIV